MYKNIQDLDYFWQHQDLTFIEQYQGVMVGCSGGVDSTVLLHLICKKLKSKKNFHIGIIHLNYGLRGQESDEDQKFIEELSNKNGLDLKIVCPSQNPGQSNVQDWARQERYKVFYQYAERDYLIALGHNQDDLAENVILRLCRGQSPEHLAGMKVFNHPFWRPLLQVPRAKIMEFAKKYQIPYREDSSNVKIEYSRNYIRHEILPKLEGLFPGCKRRIAATAIEIQEQLEYYSASDVNPVLANIKNLPDGVAVAHLARLLQHKNIEVKTLSKHVLYAIVRHLKKDDGNKSWQIALPGNKRLTIENGDILWRDPH